MDPTDTSKRKPRQTRGTPSYYYRNRFAFGAIVAGCALFGLWSLTPVFQKGNQRALELFEDTEEGIERRTLFDVVLIPRTSSSIQEVIDERDRIVSER